MASNLRIYIIFFGLLYVLNAAGAPQQPLRRLDEKTWQSLTADKNYRDETCKRNTFDSKAQPDRELVFYPLDKPDPFHQPNQWFQLLGFLIPGVLMFCLIWLLARKYWKQPNRQVSSDQWNFSIANLEDRLEHADVSHFILRAVEAGNYKLAIRLYYLNVLKELSSKGHIKWKKDKTNLHYQVEMSSHPMQRDFFLLTVSFEKIWYGNAAANQITANEYRQLHDQFLININQNI